jgi:hypothetical protein
MIMLRVPVPIGIIKEDEFRHVDKISQDLNEIKSNEEMFFLPIISGAAEYLYFNGHQFDYDVEIVYRLESPYTSIKIEVL